MLLAAARWFAQRKFELFPVRSLANKSLRDVCDRRHITRECGLVTEFDV